MENVLIIGGGVAGLSAGIYAQKRGYRAIICEKHDKLGGNLTGWQRGDYHIDNCIHWLTGTNKNTDLYKTWVELGALDGVGIYQGESLYTYEKDGQRLSLSNDIVKLTNDMLSISPEDRDEILSFVQAVKYVQGVTGIAGRMHDQKYTVLQKIRYAPALAKYALKSVGQVSKRFKNEVIRGFLNCLLTEDFSAFALIYVFSTFTGGDGGIPIGGSLKTAQRMTDRFIDLGGKVLTDKEVVKINLVEGRARSVILSDGSEITADAVIITADPKTVFGKMLDAPMPNAFERAYKSKRFRRFSCFQCAFSCDIEKMPFRGDLIFDLDEKCRRLLSTKYLILREFSHEKSFAPEGKNILQAMIFCDEQTSKSFIGLKNNKIAYLAKKQFLANVILQATVERLPELRDRLQIIDTWTPATYKRYVSSEIGSFMGFTLPAGIVPKQISNKIDGIDNVLLATQWQSAPGGLPTSAMLGKLAIETLDKKAYFVRSAEKTTQRKRFTPQIER